MIISVILTPVLRRRLDEKFARGADNQAFLVDLSAAPKPSRRWPSSRKCSGDGKTNWRALCVPASMRRPWAMSAARSSSSSIRSPSSATLYLGAKLVMAGELTVGELVAFNMLAGRVAQPVLRIAQLWQDFQQAEISIARLGDILNTQREPAQKGAASLPPIKGDIRFEHVTFRYLLNGPTVLSDVFAACDAGPGRSASSGHRDRASPPWPSWCSAFTPRSPVAS